MTRDTLLKKHADKLSALVSQLNSLRKEFDKEYRDFRKDATTQWQDRKSKFDYVVKELMAPVDSIFTDNMDYVQGLLSDAQEIVQIESGYEATQSAPEDLLGGKKAMSEIELKKQELERRREAGLKFAASKKQIVASLFVDTDDDSEPTEEQEAEVRSFDEIQHEVNRKAAEANRKNAEFVRKNFEFKPN